MNNIMDIVDQVDERIEVEVKQKTSDGVDAWGAKTFPSKGSLPKGETAKWLLEIVRAFPNLKRLFTINSRAQFNKQLPVELERFFRNINDGRISGYNPATHIAISVEDILKMTPAELKKLQSTVAPSDEADAPQ